MTPDPITEIDAQITAAETHLATLRDERDRLLVAKRNAMLDAQLERLSPEVIAALREPYPRAKDLAMLRAKGLAYSNGGSSRFWTRDKGEPLRRRLMERT